MRVDAQENDVAAAMKNVAGNEDAEVVAMIGEVAVGGEEKNVVDEEGEGGEVVCDADFQTGVRFVVVEEEAIQVEVVGREVAEEVMIVIGGVFVLSEPVLARIGDEQRTRVEREPNRGQRVLFGKNRPILFGREDVGH